MKRLKLTTPEVRRGREGTRTTFPEARITEVLLDVPNRAIRVTHALWEEHQAPDKQSVVWNSAEPVELTLDHRQVPPAVKALYGALMDALLAELAARGELAGPGAIEEDGA